MSSAIGEIVLPIRYDLEAEQAQLAALEARMLATGRAGAEAFTNGASELGTFQAGILALSSSFSTSSQAIVAGMRQIAAEERAAAQTAAETARQRAASDEERRRAAAAAAAESAARAREAAQAQEVEDKYAALSLTNGDRVLAQRYLALNREYARELALVDHSSATKIQIEQRYAQEMSALEDEVRQRQVSSSNASQGALRGTGAAAEAGGTALSRLADRLMAYRMEETQTARATSFFARELGSLIPVSQGASQGLASVAGILLQGSIFGMAAEGVKLLVGEIVEWYRAEEEVAKKTRALALDTTIAIGDMRQGWQRFRDELEKPLSPGQQKARAELDALKQAQDEADKKYDESIQKRKKLQAELAESERQRAQAGLEAGVGESAVIGAKLQNLNRELRDYDAETAERARKRAQIAAASDPAIADERKKADEDAARQRLVAAAKYGSEEVRLRREADVQIAELDRKVNVLSADELTRQRNQIIATRDEEILRAREQRFAAHFQAMQGFRGVGATAEQQAQIEAENQLLKLGIEYDQAKRAGNTQRMREIREEMQAASDATSKRLALFDNERVIAQSLYSVQTRFRENVDEGMQRSIEQADLATERWRILRNLQDAGGDVAVAQQLAAQQKEEAELRHELTQMAIDQPEMAGQVELALTKLKQKGAKDRAAIVAQEQQAELAATSNFFGTLASMQSSSIKELAAIGKAAALTQATIDAYLAINKALATLPPPMSYLQAAAIGATAFANVSRIAGFRKGGYTGDGPEDEEAGPVHRGEVVFDAPAVRSIGKDRLEAMRRGDAPADGAGMTVNVHNYVGASVQVEQLSRGEIAVMIREGVRAEAPKVYEQQIARADSRVSRATSRYTTARPVR